MESVASETVDDTLIVNGKSSYQEKTEISATYSWSHAAATRIQKHYRGFRTRRILAVSKAAATRIQKHYRGFRTRRILAVSKAAATRIQKHYRGFRTRRILAVSKAAAIRIQKHYRGFRTRRNLADSIIAAELLWQTTLSHTPNTGKVADVNIESEKHIVSLLKWAETRVEKYGNLSRDQLALLHCWETVSQHANFYVSIHLYIQHCTCYSQFVFFLQIDPRLRYSWNSHFFI
ncbi:uncharacterized protein [Populus alba]|uniref:uncharacterized protein n=1 Tax=Populus alba TaxID=43335 RepID=UPI003CC6E37A